MEEFLYPRRAEQRIVELLNPSTSIETKANICRWYLEMMIAKFFIENLGEDDQNKVKNQKILKNKIEMLKKYGAITDRTFNTMEYLREKGNIGTHYDEVLNISESETEEIVRKALSLFDEVILIFFEKNRYDYHKTPTLFSTLTPIFRERVLLVYFENVLDSYDHIDPKDPYIHLLIEKIALAKVKKKDSEFEETQIFLQKYRDLGWIDSFSFNLYLDRSQRIFLTKNDWPIANNLNECRLNFNNVIERLKNMNVLKENKKFISILEALLDQVDASEPDPTKHRTNTVFLQVMMIKNPS